MFDNYKSSLILFELLTKREFIDDSINLRGFHLINMPSFATLAWCRWLTYHLDWNKIILKSSIK